MDKFENLQTSSENKQHYIPMEVTAETIKDFGITPRMWYGRESVTARRVSL